MKKSNKFKLFIAAAGLIGATANAQLVDEKDVSITMDLQPVLQLEMTTPDQIEFVFDDISEYQAGITQYAATVLKVSSTVSWDLYAVGRSQGNTAPGFWDQQVDYGDDNVNAVDQLPLSLLELRQNRQNLSTRLDPTKLDYSANFQNPNTLGALAPYAGTNNIYVDAAGAGTPPSATDRYIAGHAGDDGIDNYMPGGTYLNQTTHTSDYYYTIDYRILPGLPAVFPMAYDLATASSESVNTLNPAAYAEPGVYTMYVQYILLEDQ
ncbi:hypothetical protein [Flavicella sp.]|uniref:hypothetical protein n=1 Tax=Flavicella sp. TaxID=2957742 RepID=UPI00260C2F87|nr:hypothetical protein [Flavicella sp.]MDG1803752.1 hypothetical protein [Flavicella sp.]MDG2279924.1 hypothetical protein [Flavicella sp.]